MVRALLISLTALFASLICDQAAAQHKNFIIMLDPGHGGTDAGAVRGRYLEKNLNLEIALTLGALIEREMPDVEVLYTRTTDVNVGLADRGERANRAGADLFLSIHTNANDKNSPNGSETYVMGMDKNEENLEVAKRENEVIKYEVDYRETYAGFDENSAEMSIIFGMMQYAHFESSLSFARLIQREYATNLPLRNRGAKQNIFAVLWRATMPRVLTEIGFISNEEDRKFIFSEDGKAKIVLSLFYAFREYKSQVDADADNLPMVAQAQPTPTSPTVTQSAPSNATVAVAAPAAPVVATQPVVAAVPAPVTPPSEMTTDAALQVPAPAPVQLPVSATEPAEPEEENASMRAYVRVAPADIAAAEAAAAASAASAAAATAQAHARDEFYNASSRPLFTEVSQNNSPATPNLDALIASGRVSRSAYPAETPSHAHQAPDTYGSSQRNPSASNYEHAYGRAYVPARNSSAPSQAENRSYIPERAPERGPEKVTERALQRPSHPYAPSTRTTFHIQLAATHSAVSTYDARWGAYRGQVVERYTDGWFKYSLGPFHSRTEAAETLDHARRGDFPGAFIVEMPANH
jgi:N-acetylmuramoyl-L-alanine amidase